MAKELPSEDNLVRMHRVTRGIVCYLPASASGTPVLVEKHPGEPVARGGGS